MRYLPYILALAAMQPACGTLNIVPCQGPLDALIASGLRHQELLDANF